MRICSWRCAAGGRGAASQTTPLTVQIPLRSISQRDLERDEDNSYVILDGLEEEPLQDIHSYSVSFYSVSFRVAIGHQKGSKAFCVDLQRKLIQ